MNIINKFGTYINEEVVNFITLELFEIVKKNYNNRKRLPTRIELIKYVITNYQKEHSLDLRCASQIEEVMEFKYSRKLEEIGYKLLNK